MTDRLVRALMPATVGVLAVLLLLCAHPTGRDSSVLNVGWNGLSQTSDMLHAAPLLSYEGVRDVASPATLVVIPRLQPSDAELDAMEAFVSSGGTLVVLDDFAFGNDVLSRLGVSIRFSGGTVMDPLYCYRNASMPQAETFSGDPATEPLVIVLDRGTWLDEAPRDLVWAWTSYFSYGDVDGDGAYDDGEPVGPLPVAATLAHGSGRVVVVADSSVLLNGVVGLADNVRALERFVEGEVLIDQVHLPEAGMDRSQGALDAIRAVVGAGTGAIALALVACGFAVGYAWYNRERQ